MRFNDTVKTIPLNHPNIKVHVHDDGDIELSPTQEPAGVSQEGQLVFGDYNKLTTELLDYGAVEPNIMAAIACVRAGEQDVKV